eukprot:353520-Chlamydomonas_euryale.AAC.2
MNGARSLHGPRGARARALHQASFAAAVAADLKDLGLQTVWAMLRHAFQHAAYHGPDCRHPPEDPQILHPLSSPLPPPLVPTHRDPPLGRTCRRVHAPLRTARRLHAPAASRACVAACVPTVQCGDTRVWKGTALRIPKKKAAAPHCWAAACSVREQHRKGCPNELSSVCGTRRRGGRVPRPSNRTTAGFALLLQPIWSGRLPLLRR